MGDANIPLVRSRFLAATEIVATDPRAQSIVRVSEAAHSRNMESLSHSDMSPTASELVQVKIVNDVSAMVYFRVIRSSPQGYTRHHYDYFYVVERASGAWRHTATYSVLTIEVQQ